MLSVHLLLTNDSLVLPNAASLGFKPCKAGVTLSFRNMNYCVYLRGLAQILRNKVLKMLTRRINFISVHIYIAVYISIRITVSHQLSKMLNTQHRVLGTEIIQKIAIDGMTQRMLNENIDNMNVLLHFMMWSISSIHWSLEYVCAASIQRCLSCFINHICYIFVPSFSQMTSIQIVSTPSNKSFGLWIFVQGSLG